MQLAPPLKHREVSHAPGVWESDNQEKATVDQTGPDRRVAEGSANISLVVSSGGKKATKAVTVNSAT
ncbi:Ig-like domain-containing protein [Escherichia coli]|uniref:Ig-like domain-containing protein n=1 Tax=Escherichia coli TaxID=562 RepID=UPI0039859442